MHLRLPTLLAALTTMTGLACTAEVPGDEPGTAEADLTTVRVTPLGDGRALADCTTDTGIWWRVAVPAAEAVDPGLCDRLRLPGTVREGSFTEVETTANGFYLKRDGGAAGSWVRLRFQAYTQWDGDASFPESAEPARLLVRDGMRGSCSAAIDVAGTKAAPSTHEITIEVRGDNAVQVVLANAFRRMYPRIARRVFVSDVEVAPAAPPTGPRGLPTGTCRQRVDGPDELPAGFDPFSPSSCTGRALSRTQRLALLGDLSKRWLEDVDVYIREAACTPEGCSDFGAPRRMRSLDEDAVTGEVTLSRTQPAPRPPGQYAPLQPDVAVGVGLWGTCAGRLSCTPSGRPDGDCSGDVLLEPSYFYRADGTHVSTCENRRNLHLNSWGTIDMRASCARFSVTVEKGRAESWKRYQLAGVARY